MQAREKKRIFLWFLLSLYCFWHDASPTIWRLVHWKDARSLLHRWEMVGVHESAAALITPRGKRREISRCLSLKLEDRCDFPWQQKRGNPFDLIFRWLWGGGSRYALSKREIPDEKKIPGFDLMFLPDWFMTKFIESDTLSMAVNTVHFIQLFQFPFLVEQGFFKTRPAAAYTTNASQTKERLDCDKK